MFGKKGMAPTVSKNSGDKATNRPMCLVVDVSYTDKTNLDRIPHDVTRYLERIPGISVLEVEKNF